MVPYDPLPLDAAAIANDAPEVLAAPVYALCVGFADTEQSVDVVGQARIFTPTTTVSVAAAVEGRFRTIGVDENDPERCDSEVPTAMLVASSSAPAALAGATEVNTPKPNVATTTSATRLKVVFVDICFLSISQS